MATTIKTGFEKWQEGLNSATDNPAWNTYDCDVQVAVTEYNRHLGTTTAYVPLNAQLIKAMLWVETGAASAQWRVKPMQIGVPGDPGLASLLSDREGGDLILPPATKAMLTVGSVGKNPGHNIRAGIGYLLMRMANFDFQSVLDADSEVHDVAVKTGDSLDKIAKTHGSTLEIMKKLNGSAVLRVGQVVHYQKATVQRVITGWRRITTQSIALRYNGGGDPNYAKKLDYALRLIRVGKAAVCTP